MYANEPFVKENNAKFKVLKEDVFERKKVEHISYESELGDFTKEKYIAVYEKIWATIRHEMWNEIQKFKKIDRVEVVSSERFNKIYEEVHSRFEPIRADVFEIVMDTTLEKRDTAREIMQKGYITYSTISSVTNADGSAEISRWADQVKTTSDKHS